MDKNLITQVRNLTKLGLIDSSFITVDSTPIMTTTSQNNPKSNDTIPALRIPGRNVCGYIARKLHRI